MKEKEYDQKVDMFGIGCVFAEMLHSIEIQNNANTKFKDRILFSDSECFPLSDDLFKKRDDLEEFDVGS